MVEPPRSKVSFANGGLVGGGGGDAKMQCSACAQNSQGCQLCNCILRLMLATDMPSKAMDDHNHLEHTHTNHHRFKTTILSVKKD